MKTRIDPRVILLGCVGWSVLAWAVVGVLVVLFYIFGEPRQRLIGTVAALVGALFLGAWVMSLGGDSAASESATSRMAGRAVPSIRSEDGISPGGLTFFGYMLVAGLQPLLFGVSLMD